MDSLTHTLLGAIVGDALLGKKIGKKAMLWGAIANNFPDIDVLGNFFTDEITALLVHRGITHSILFTVLVPFAFGKLFHRIYRNTLVSYREWTYFFFVNFALHILIDSATAYGTGWFEPFSSYRVAFNTMFIFDPLFTFILLIPCIALLVLKSASRKRIRWIKIGLYGAMIYEGVTCCNKLVVKRTVESALQQQQIAYSDYFSTPTPLNNILWYVIAKTNEGYRIGYYSLADKNDLIKFRAVPKNDSLLLPFRNEKQVETFIRFTQQWYTVTNDSSQNKWLNDMRFGQIGGWGESDAPFVFSIPLTNENIDEVNIQRGRMKASTGEALSSLWNRIKGN